MKKDKNNDPAYPTNGDYAPGLTKREYFAAATLQGIVANSYHRCLSDKEVAERAVSLADALIEALNQ